eukprot:263269-Amphidinium_carterae.3
MQGACQDIRWSNRAPEGFADFVDQCATSEDAGIHLNPPFATQSVGPPPGLRHQPEIDERGPQTPERRPQYSSSSPEFGLNGEMNGHSGNRGSGSHGSGKGAGSTPNRVIGSPNPLSGRSDLDPLQGRAGNRTRGGGRGGDGPGDDDDDNKDGNGGNRGNQPLGEWNNGNDPWYGALSTALQPRQLALVSAAPGGDDPGRNPSSIVHSFDLFSEELAKSANAFFPTAVRESTPPRSRRSYGGGGGGSGGNDPDDPLHWQPEWKR